MKLTTAIDQYIQDMQREGRLRSPHSELAYRSKLMKLAEHVGNRDPRTVGRNEIKAVLATWPNPSSQNQAHSVYAAFFDYAQEEGWCKYNPARRVRRARRTKPDIYRMTREEVRLFLAASNDRR